MLAVVFLVVYAWQVLDTGASPIVHTGLETVMWAIWLVFAIDYGTRFVWRHLLDRIAVVLPMARQLSIEDTTQRELRALRAELAALRTQLNGAEREAM